MKTRERSRLLVMLATAVLVATCFAGLLRLSSQAAAYSGVTVNVQCPSFAGKSETVVVTIIVAGGPAADVGGNYSYMDVEMTGTNTTGWKVEPTTQMSESGVFKFNLTMPTEAGQTVKVSLNATSDEWKTGEETYTIADFKIKVVDPIVIIAKVFNNGVVDAVNATAEIFADGTLLETQTINLTAGSSQTIVYNWTFASIRSGKHIVTVKIDDPANLVEFSDGNNEYTITIYVGSQANPMGGVLTVGLLIAIVFFVLTYMQKPVRRGKKP